MHYFTILQKTFWILKNDYLFKISYVIGEMNVSFIISNNKLPFITFAQIKL
jgi:hypothetical protein